ncbi:MAG TPA: tetratricopeptide repeat protein [Chthoniobacterales bacterium]|jgi:tetratricopeptide (TPR) repeat protein|nr:tetratricopeptide repeat protein [Chthoniobacterales bacterium]
MNNKRSAAFWSAVFLVLGCYLISVGSAFAQSQPGWGGIWQQRMTIGQAQLDTAFKLAESGKVNEALAIIDQVIATDPNNWRSYFLKSAVLVLARRGDEALKVIDRSINLARRSNVSSDLLAELYESKARSCIDYGHYDEARKSLEQAVHLDPSDPSTLNDLAWMLATTKDARVRNGRRAVAIATKACALSNWDNAFSIDTLAAAYAAAGNFSDAVKYQQMAISRLKPEDRNVQLAGMQRRLQQYVIGQPFTVL